MSNPEDKGGIPIPEELREALLNFTPPKQNRFSEELFRRELPSRFPILEANDTALLREVRELREEVRELRSVISGLILRMDLKNLDVDPNDVFLPGLIKGR